MKGDQIIDEQTITNEQRFYLFNYLKNSSDLTQMLITDAGLSKSDAKIIFQDSSFSLNVETSKNNFKKIDLKLRQLLLTLYSEPLTLESFINLYMDQPKQLNGVKLRKKIEEDYSVRVLMLA